MYDTSLTRQALPSKRYCYLLGVALSVFISNNGFIIENILRTDILRTDSSKEWSKLIDKESGRLKADIAETISAVAGNDIYTLFEEIVGMRNRIIHGFRITAASGEQIIATKERNGNQYYIDELYLTRFIRLNERLSSMLHDYRGF